MSTLPQARLTGPEALAGSFEPAGGPELHALSCVIHLHSTYSDGTATVEELIEAGREAGRDAVLLTDHDTLGAKHDGYEGWHGSLLLAVGTEVSPKRGHYLAFGIDEPIAHQEMNEAEIPSAVAAGGGFGFVAHPFSIGSQMTTRYGRKHEWRGLDHEAVAGIELWSLTTDIAERWTNVREAIRYMRHPERQLDGPPAHHLEAWDRLCETRRVAAIGGLDAHQHGFRIAGRMITPMPNSRYFRLLGTYALLREPPSGDDEADIATLYEALREGRSYLGVDGFASARGFDFRAIGGGSVALMGEEHPAGEWTLRVAAPQEARLVILRGGREVASAEGVELEHEVTEPGAYRAEARLRVDGREQRWILSNPIYLRAADSLG
ncbi:MAG: CehA/McbA family metallohydrolase [Solirubrobacterales bacterium]